MVARLEIGRPGRTLQFDGHLDTVHLPFVPFGEDGEQITGSGGVGHEGRASPPRSRRCSRPGTRASLAAGSILLTAHDLHEAPWGFGRQFDRLIADGFVGDAVLIPEPLRDHLPVAGRGQACWKVTIRRDGPPVHEVMRPPDAPRVIAAAPSLSAGSARSTTASSAEVDPVAGRSSAFIGQVHAGEIFNGPAELPS